MSKVCIFFATGYEEIEALTVVDILRRAEIDVEMVSVTGEKMVTSSHNITVEMDKLFNEVVFENVDMLVLPGGMPGTTNLEAFEPLMKKVDEFYNNGKYVAAICAAPSILGHRGILKGKTACSYPTFESHLEGAVVSKKAAVVDGNVITGRGMGAAIPFALAILTELKDSDEAEAMKEKIVYESQI